MQNQEAFLLGLLSSFIVVRRVANGSRIDVTHSKSIVVRTGSRIIRT